MPHTIQATADDDIFRLGCRHIFTDGHRCGSPALRHQDFCFYHNRARRPGPRQPQVSGSATPLRAAKLATFDLPSPADLAERAGLALAIGQIMHKIAHNEIDPRRAGLLLYAVSIASGNLAKPPRQQPATPVGPRVDELDADPVQGPLAPEAEWEEPAAPGAMGTKTLSRWAREMRQGSGRPYDNSEDLAEEAEAQAKLAAALAAKAAARNAQPAPIHLQAAAATPQPSNPPTSDPQPQPANRSTPQTLVPRSSNTTGAHPKAHKHLPRPNSPAENTRRSQTKPLQSCHRKPRAAPLQGSKNLLV